MLLLLALTIAMVLPPVSYANKLPIEIGTVLEVGNNSKIIAAPAGQVKWVGTPDSSYQWEGGRLYKEVKGIKVYVKPIEVITSNSLKSATQVRGASFNCKQKARAKFGGFGDFIWIDNVNEAGTIILPYTYPHVFIATGDWLDPMITEIYTSSANGRPYYEIINGKTYVYVDHFSGTGGVWITPTGHSDPDSAWTGPPYAYDENLSTYAKNDHGGGRIGKYLELNVTAIPCNKIRLYADEYYYDFGHYYVNPNVSIDVYYSAAWHNIFEGTITRNTWVNKSIGSDETVTKARIKSNNAADTTHDLYLKEFEFWDINVTVPSITTTAATSLTTSTAQLNSYLNDDGGELCDIRFQYNTTTLPCNATNCTTWTYNTTWVNDTASTGGSPYNSTSGLVNNTSYCFRVQARNANTTVTGTPLCFTTLITVGNVTNLQAYPKDIFVDLAWIKGTSADKTMIRYKVGSYPADETDGNQVYFDTLSSCTHSGLIPGTSYYYRAWAESGTSYSSGYSEAMITTSAGEGAAAEPSAPSTPTSWFGAPDYTKMENVFFYSIFNDIADDYSVPRNSFWFMITLLAIGVLGIFVYSQCHNPTISIIVAGVAMVIASRMGLMSLFFLFVFGVIAAGSIMIERRV